MDEHRLLGDLSEMKTAIRQTMWVLFALGWAGCASVQPMQSETSNPDEPMGLADIFQARLEQSADEPVHVVRYNPTSCRCPPFEILLSDHWYRVDLAVFDVDNPILAELLQLTSDSRREEALKRYRLAGTFESIFRECGRGLPMFTFRPQEFKGVEPPPPSQPQRPSRPLELQEPDDAHHEESLWKRTALNPCG